MQSIDSGSSAQLCAPPYRIWRLARPASYNGLEQLNGSHHLDDFKRRRMCTDRRNKHSEGWTGGGVYRVCAGQLSHSSHHIRDVQQVHIQYEFVRREGLGWWSVTEDKVRGSADGEMLDIQYYSTSVLLCLYNTPYRTKYCTLCYTSTVPYTPVTVNTADELRLQ